MQLQTLVFNTTTKTVKVFNQEQELIYEFENIPTVKIKDEGFYEVIQKEKHSDGIDSNYPIARFPVSFTNMIIKK